MNTTGVKNRRIRIALLSILKTEYPGALDMRALQFALDNLGYPMPAGALEAHLRYLEEKKLARVETREGMGFSIAFAYLTAVGWDFLDGALSNAGEGRGDSEWRGGIDERL